MTANNTAPGSPEGGARVVMYRTRTCPYCVMAARLLDRMGIGFEEVDVTGDSERRRWLLEVSRQRTVPQIFIDGRSIGGYDELSRMARRGELTAWLALPSGGAPSGGAPPGGAPPGAARGS